MLIFLPYKCLLLTRMNNRIKEIIVAINNHRIVYADTNLTTFIRGMEALEPSINSKSVLKKNLDKRGVHFFVNEKGYVYEIYKYSNIDYVGTNNVLP